MGGPYRTVQFRCPRMGKCRAAQDAQESGRWPAELSQHPSVPVAYRPTVLTSQRLGGQTLQAD